PRTRGREEEQRAHSRNQPFKQGLGIMTLTTNQPVKPIEPPAGLDLHPKWAGIVRLSKPAALIVGLLALVVIVGCLYGVVRRSVAKMQIASPVEQKRIAPATQAGQEMASLRGSRPPAAMGKLVAPG